MSQTKAQTKQPMTPADLATPLLLMGSAGIMAGIVSNYVMVVGLYGTKSLLKSQLRTGRN